LLPFAIGGIPNLHANVKPWAAVKVRLRPHKKTPPRYLGGALIFKALAELLDSYRERLLTLAATGIRISSHESIGSVA
jgi:hypothetical protein